MLQIDMSMYCSGLASWRRICFEMAAHDLATHAIRSLAGRR